MSAVPTRCRICGVELLMTVDCSVIGPRARWWANLVVEMSHPKGGDCANGAYRFVMVAGLMGDDAARKEAGEILGSGAELLFA